MTNPKHTPGPWVWGNWSILDEDRPAQQRNEPYWTLEKGLEDTLTQGPLGRKVRDTIHIVEPLGWETEGLGASEANKRLIAAAPDLLEALKAVLSVADRKTKEFDAARTAIAKAEGDDK